MRTAIKRVRRPDVTIECGPTDPNALESRQPIAVFEVMSPSNRPGAIAIKVEEYKRHPAVRHIVLIEPGIIEVAVLSKAADGSWSDRVDSTTDDVIDLEPPGVKLGLSDIYNGVPIPTAEVALKEF